MEMNAALIRLLEGFISIGVFILLGLEMLLMSRLKQYHPDKFQALGAPRLLIPGTPGTNWLLVGFLFRREHKKLDDAILSRLSDVTLIFFVLFLSAFTCVVWINI